MPAILRSRVPPGKIKAMPGTISSTCHFKNTQESFESFLGKANSLGCASSEDSDQPGNLLSLVSLHCPHEESSCPKPPPLNPE